jgi:DNA-directed RNA polymerase III subunit RPC3
MNGTSSPMKRQNRMLNFASDESDLPEVQLNGADRTEEGNFRRRKEIVKRHLEALAGDEPSLIRPSNGTKKLDDTDDEEWSVNLISLQQFIRIKEIERIVRGKYGSESLRLLRIVNQKHHVDQDQVASLISKLIIFQFEKLVLLKNAQIRLLLPQLQAGGILEVVEIPKAGGIDRSKNYNLLSFHESRARAFLLQDLYKTLIKIYQRINEERARKQGIIAKAQRTDVKKDLKRYLSRDELKSYNAWKVLEDRLLGQVMRIDKSVMLLKDV